MDIFTRNRKPNMMKNASLGNRAKISGLHNTKKAVELYKH